MASEDLLRNAVAAFNALSPEQRAEMMEEQRQSWVRGNIGLSRDERSMTSTVMQRPAPAATDTGLETGLWAMTDVNGKPTNVTTSVNDAKVWLELGYILTEYVTRSQAEELLADLHAAIAVKDHGLKLLKADNEAQAARIKELEEYAREATKAITGLTGGGSENFGKPIGELYPADLSFCLERIRDRYVSKAELKRLEAKLAATEKALEPFALISSEGVIKQQTGHVTVITCAEYFHKARAVLGGKP